MTEKNERQEANGVEKNHLRRVLGKIIMWIGISIVLFVFIIGMYISLAAYTGQFIPVTDSGSLLTPVLLTGIILILFGIAAILYPTGPSKDGSWVLMTGPYVR